MWRAVTKEEEGNWNIWHKKMQELNPNTSENYLLNTMCVCVFVCVWPLISFYGNGRKALQLYIHSSIFIHGMHRDSCNFIILGLQKFELQKSTQIWHIFPAFYGTRRFLTALTSARHLSLSWASPIQSSYPNPTSLLKVHPNIILPSTPGSPQQSLPLGFPHHHPVHSSPYPHTGHMPRPAHSCRFYHQHDIGWWVQTFQLLIM